MKKLAYYLVIIGGLNWLLFALFNWEIGQLFGGMDSAIATIIYVLIGLSALYMLFTRKNP